MTRLIRGFVFIVGVHLFVSPTFCQQWKTDVGYVQLQNEIGRGLEMGESIDAMFVEAEDAEDDYMPDLANSAFVSKNFVFGSGPSGTSTHSNSVCARFFGSNCSISPKAGDDVSHPVTGFTAIDWLNFELGIATGADPNFHPYHVSNHAYIAEIGPGLSESQAVNLLRRLDFAINQSGMTTVVGTNNGNANTPLPALLVHGYNSITVGVTDGGHASSFNNPTYLYGNGRIKPEIVAPATLTSFSTPMVSGAAGLLQEAGAGTDAVRSETLKAILLAGATKDEFSVWTRSPSSPLDRKFGAGELNIYNSYQIINSSEFDGTVGDPPNPVTNNGWDYEPLIDAGGERFYEFVVAENTMISELSALLTWNMEIIDQNPGALFDPVELLADMNLEFYDSTNGFKDLAIDSSNSPVDNIEHVYLQNLLPGTYHLRVNSDIAHDFGLAWRSTVVPAPTIAAKRKRLRKGIISAGLLSDTFQSDDLYLELDPSPTADPLTQKIELTLLAQTSIPAPGMFGFRVEAAMIGGPEGDVIQIIDLWNDTNKTWEEFDRRAATTAETVVKVTASGDLTRFIDPLHNKVIARITWESPQFNGAPFFWGIDLDQAVWQTAE